MDSANSVPTVTLNDGVEIPQLGFGTYQVPPEQTAEIVSQALEVGYRHIDTAQMYQNEAGVGEAIARSGLARDELFVTSKLNNGFHAPDDARRSFDETLDRLGLEHIDLFLIHWPLAMVIDFVPTWRTLEEFAASGRARSIGVSNFAVEHLQRLFDETGTVPSVNQIEVHPYFSQQRLRGFGREHGIVTEAWSPIAQGDVTDDAELIRIGERYGKTAAQVTLRWHIQRGDVVFPKTMSEERMRENLDVFDFELDDEAMTAIDALDRDHRYGPDPTTFDFVPDAD